MFASYLELGFDHILDFRGYDHILFLIALCAPFASTDWKKILILVTAFTIGHSITLALSALDIIVYGEYEFYFRRSHYKIIINENLIETLIPITILITAIINLIVKPNTTKRWQFSYLLPLFFGLIHGLGFSNYFKALLGREAEIILPLFAFNIGVELGQICIVALIMFINFIAVGIGKLAQRNWNIIVSIIAAILSLYMIIGKM